MGFIRHENQKSCEEWKDQSAIWKLIWYQNRLLKLLHFALYTFSLFTKWTNLQKCYEKKETVWISPKLLKKKAWHKRQGTIFGSGDVVVAIPGRLWLIHKDDTMFCGTLIHYLCNHRICFHIFICKKTRKHMTQISVTSSSTNPSTYLGYPHGPHSIRLGI